MLWTIIRKARNHCQDVDNCGDEDHCQYHLGIDHCQNGNCCQDREHDEFSIILYLQSEIDFCSVRMPVNA